MHKAVSSPVANPYLDQGGVSLVDQQDIDGFCAGTSQRMPMGDHTNKAGSWISDS